MTRKRRLERLEQLLEARWRAVWEGYAEAVQRHTEGLGEPLLEAAKVAKAEGLKDEQAEAFFASLGVPPLEASGHKAWAERDTIPDLDAAPDLALWPDRIPEPPPEPPGAWAALELYRESADPVERFAALLYLLGMARGHREYLESLLSQPAS